jgi:predicted Zn-dependent protease with MMP-like domain
MAPELSSLALAVVPLAGLRLISRRGLPRKGGVAISTGMTQIAPAAIAPDLAQIEQIAHEAVVALPEPYRAAATQIILRIEDFAPEDVLEAMDLHDPFELTGLYDGIPLTEKSVMDQQTQPDVIWLFRRPILDEWADRGNVSLQEMVTHVMVHELAHHFGWTDEDIAQIDPWWE